MNQTYIEAIARTRRYVLDNPDVLNDTTRWIVGQGWDQNLWKDQSYPLAVRRAYSVFRTCSTD